MIPQQKVLKIFKLINLLKRPGGKTVPDLAGILESSIRSVQRYIKLLEELGLFVEKDFSGRYFLCSFNDHEEDLLQFTSEESAFLNQLLLSTSSGHPLTASLQKKIYVHGETYILPEYLEKSRLVRFVTLLQKAIDQKRQVVIKSYHSAHSQEIGDRLVEPFAFDKNYAVIQAYEPVSGKNKFFKLERIGDLSVLNKKQSHIKSHKKQHTDCFGYAGDQVIHVQLKLTLRASLLLREEYPASVSYLCKDSNKYLFDGPVYQLEGIARFVMGFLDQVEMVSPDKLKVYIKEKITDWLLQQKLSQSPVNVAAPKDSEINK